VPPNAETSSRSPPGPRRVLRRADAEQLGTVYENLGSGSAPRRVGDHDVFSAGAAVFLLVGGALSAFLFRRVP
jgi:hypothetical protein